MTDENFLESGVVNDIIEDKIREAIKVECDRQHVGEDRQQMLGAVYYMIHHNHVVSPELTTVRLMNLARMIEPSNGGVYRTLPVTFNGVVGGVPPQNIERSMEVWIDYFNEEMKWIRGTIESQPAVLVDKVIKEFLDIHPFSDGNGRTAWLLRVWMMNQWDNPQPLPDYYKEV